MKRIISCICLCFAFISLASINPNPSSLLGRFSKEYKNKLDIIQLKKDVIEMGGKSVPTLIKVMKSSKYPEKNRWVATFLLGRIAGVKSAPFISKFLKHPHWVMRMASLKTLLALKQKKYATSYAYLLKDGSLLVRIQALENLRRLDLRSLAPQVWSMLYDKRNYYQVKNINKRSNIIKSVVKTIGDLRFEKARLPLLKMIRKEKYKDIFIEMDYALSKIVGKKSPSKSSAAKRHFWNTFYRSEQII